MARRIVEHVPAPVGENESRVVIHHSGWGDGGQWDQTYDYFDNAWGRVLGNLKRRFDEGPVDWSEWLARLKAMADAPRDSAKK